MNPEVTGLAGDSGALVTAGGIKNPAGRFMALQLKFVAGTLWISCDNDTDEVIMQVGDDAVAERDSFEPAFPELIGLAIEYAWILVNHRGYHDAFQLRLSDGHSRSETLQFEVAASAMEVYRVMHWG